MDQEVRVEHGALVAAIREVLEGAGVPAPVSRVEAEVTAEADLLGVPSHGVRMVPALVKAIREGRATPDPQVRIVRERGATCVLDCDNGPGRYVSVLGMRHAVGRAREAGVGVCLARRTTHWGRAHAYAWRAAQAGMIGVCATNAIPNMLAFGSSGRLVGNNPLAIAVPAGEGRDPVVLDMAMSQAALGKVGTYLREGKKAPPGWGLDADGRPTDDPATILASRKILPFGGHKGAGLGVMIELLTGALSGGLLAHEMARSDASGLDREATKLFLALDPAAFLDPEHFCRRVRDSLTFLQTAEPGLTVLYPGERGWQVRDRYLAEGIPIPTDIIAELRALGASPG
ncbi:MAG: Ldh family oxidoreductase [Armatimonadetes bacterium]|nr:Ldh family oxidoreductase [Armatimonadota bacterium]